MVSPLQRNAPEIIGLMGLGLLLFQHSKYIPIMKTNKWVQNIALRINTRFAFVPVTLLSFGIFRRVRNRKVESLNGQLKSDLITRLPCLALSKSCSYLGRSDISYVARSCRKFNESIQTQEVQSLLIEQLAFGPKDWKRFFGEVGEVPPIPENMAEILKSQCPFNPGKQVRDTHMLVLIPYTVNSRPFTLNLLKELIENPQGKEATSFGYYPQTFKDALGNAQEARPYWVLMVKDVIPGSRNKTYDEQKQLVEDKGKDSYEVPSAITAAAIILMHYLKTGESLYGQDHTIKALGFTANYTRCHTGTEDPWPTGIGCPCGPGRVAFHICPPGYKGYDAGMAAVRKF